MAGFEAEICVVDSDVLIDFLKGRREAVERMAALPAGCRVATTAFNALELYRGACRRGLDAVEKVDAFTRSVIVLPLSLAAARRAGSICCKLEAAGTPLDMGDVVIAAIVLENGGVLLTGNNRHFSKIEGLELV